MVTIGYRYLIEAISLFIIFYVMASIKIKGNYFFSYKFIFAYFLIFYILAVFFDPFLWRYFHGAEGTYLQLLNASFVINTILLGVFFMAVGLSGRELPKLSDILKKYLEREKSI